MNISQALDLAKNNNLDILDAEILLSYILKCERVYLKAWPEKNIADNNLEEYKRIIKKRAMGVPVAYIVGFKYFWNFKLFVSNQVLIPRPETEILVEQVLIRLDKLDKLNKLNNKKEKIKILELGTGSGAIAIALASEIKKFKNLEIPEIIATDNSQEALNIARKNSQELNIKNISFLLSNWFENIDIGFDNNNKFDLIISNPPYIAEQDQHLSGDIRFEPLQALIAGHDGLECLYLIIKQAKLFLKPQGCLFLEHGIYQERFLQKIFIESGYNKIQNYKDLSGIFRAVKADLFVGPLCF